MRTRPYHGWLMACLVGGLGLASSPAFAQAPVAQQPPARPVPATRSGAEGFGIQLGGGPIFANLADTQGLKVDSKTGYLFGLLMGGNRGGVLGVEADVLYGKKGVTLHLPPILGGDQDFEQQVVHVPVMLKVNAGSGNVNGLSAFGVGGTFFDWQFDSTLGTSPRDNTNGFEVGWVLGGGVEVLRFSVQARYMRGVRQISKEFDVTGSTESDSKSFVVLFAFRLN